MRRILAPLYHIWFYIVVAIVTILLSPFLIVSILHQSWYPYFFKLAKLWSVIIIYGIGCYPVIQRDFKTEKGKSYLFVANHTSMTDIMLLFYVIPNPFVFIGKKELSKLPIFGYIYRRTSILVDRKNTKSRIEAFKNAQAKLNKGLSICIFPEGGVPNSEIILDDFKEGAFQLAITHQIPIVPLTLHDNKKRFPYDLFRGMPGKMRVKVHSLIPVKDLKINDRKELKKLTRDIILNELLHPTVK